MFDGSPAVMSSDDSSFPGAPPVTPAERKRAARLRRRIRRGRRPLESEVVWLRWFESRCRQRGPSILDAITAMDEREVRSRQVVVMEVLVDSPLWRIIDAWQEAEELRTATAAPAGVEWGRR